MTSFFLLAQALFGGFHPFDLFSFGLAKCVDFFLELLLALRATLETDLTAAACFFKCPQTCFGLFDALHILLAPFDGFRIFNAYLLGLLSMLLRFRFGYVAGLHLCGQLSLHVFEALNLLLFLLAQN